MRWSIQPIVYKRPIRYLIHRRLRHSPLSLLAPILPMCPLHRSHWLKCRRSWGHSHSPHPPSHLQRAHRRVCVTVPCCVYQSHHRAHPRRTRRRSELQNRNRPSTRSSHSQSKLESEKSNNNNNINTNTTLLQMRHPTQSNHPNPTLHQLHP